MKTLKRMAAVAMTVLAMGGSAQAATCASITPVISYDAFTSCTSSGQDDFAAVSAIVGTLFGGDVTLTGAGSYAPGPGAGDEFGPGDYSRNGLSLQEPVDFGSQTSFTFLSLPANTLFVSLKQSTGFELFRVPQAFLDGLTASFTLTHSLEPNSSTSHLSTFAGTVAAPIPLPAGGVLLLTALGGLVLARRRKA